MSGEVIQNMVRVNDNVPDEPPQTKQDCSGGTIRYDEQFHLVQFGSDQPLSHVRYRIVASTGELFEGWTDADGYTARVGTRHPAVLRVEVYEMTENGVTDHDSG